MTPLNKTCIFLAAMALLLLPAWDSSAQSRSVKGLVQDETNAPVAGAFVTVKGETRGVMTDGDGRFDISVKDPIWTI